MQIYRVEHTTTQCVHCMASSIDLGTFGCRLHMYTHVPGFYSALTFVLYEAFWILNYPPQRIVVNF